MQQKPMGRGNLLIAAGIFLVLLGLYLFTAPPTIVSEDDGLFVLASYFNGIPHPPGYPVFTKLGHWASQVPWGNVAERVHAVSSVFGALASVLLWSITLKLTKDRLAAATAALALGISQVFWSQALFAEVYTLNLFFMLAVLRLLLGLYQTQASSLSGQLKPKQNSTETALLIGLAGFMYGLSLSNHWPLMGLVTPAFALLLWPFRWQLLKGLYWILPLSLLGLLPYLWMFYKSQGNLLISFMGPLQDMNDLWFFVSREGYADVDNQIGANYTDKLEFTGYFARQWLQQLSLPAAALGLFGLYRQAKHGTSLLTWALLLILLGTSMVLIILLNFRYDAFNENTFRVYPIPAYSILALACGLAIHHLRAFEGKWPQWQSHYWPHLASVLILVPALMINFPLNDRREDIWQEKFARTLLEELPKGSFLLLNSDTNVGPVAYLHMVQGLRPDITLFNELGLVFPTRLTLPLRSGSDATSRLSQFLWQSDLPVPVARVANGDRTKPWSNRWLFGLRQPTGSAEQSTRLSPRLYAYFDELLSERSNDHWTHIHHENLMGQMAYLLTNAQLHPEHAEGIRKPLEKDLDAVLASPSGRIYQLQVRIQNRTPGDVAAIENSFQTLANDLNADFDHKRMALLYRLLGTFHIQEGRKNDGVSAYLKSLELEPDPNTRAFHFLKELFEKSGSEKGMQALKAIVPQGFKSTHRPSAEPAL